MSFQEALSAHVRTTGVLVTPKFNTSLWPQASEGALLVLLRSVTRILYIQTLYPAGSLCLRIGTMVYQGDIRKEGTM